MKRIICAWFLSVLVATPIATAQDARNKWCEDILAKLGRISQKEKRENESGQKLPEGPKEPPLSFPLDLSKLDAESVKHASQQISESTGQDFLVIDQCSLARPEIQQALQQAPGRLILKINDSDPKAAKDILSAHSKVVTMMVAIPTTVNEVKAVYGDKPAIIAEWTADRLRGVTQNVMDLKSASATRIVNVERPTLAVDLIAKIQAAGDGEFIVIVGHNENGVLKLPSGDSVEVAKLNAALAERNLKGVVITCESMKCACEKTEQEVLTNRKLRFDEIACALRAVVAAFIVDGTCGANDNILRELSKALTTCFKAKDAKFKIAVAVGGGAVLTATVVELVDLDGHDKPKDKKPPTPDSDKKPEKREKP